MRLFHPVCSTILLSCALSVAGCDTVADVLDPSPELVVAIGASTLEVAEGEMVTYTVVVSNRGPDSATDVAATVALPNDIHQLEWPPGTSCPGVTCGSGEVMAWDIGTLAAGQSRSLSFGLETASDREGYTHVVSVSASAPGARAASATTQVRVEDSRGGFMSISAPDASGHPGSEVTFDLTFASRGALQNTTLRFPVPSGFEFVSASDEGTLAEGVVTWATDDVAANTAGRRSVTLRIAGSREAGHTLTAQAQWTGAAGFRASSQAAIIVAPPSTLNVEVQAVPQAVSAGEQVTYTVHVSNTGTTTSTGVVATVALPDDIHQLEWPPGTSCPGVTCGIGEVMAWDIGTLAAGQSRSLSFGLETASDYEGYMHAVSVSANASEVSAASATSATPVLD